MNHIQHHAERHMFTLLQDKRQAGYLSYRPGPGGWDIEHTVIDPAYRGQGLARLLVDAAIAEAARQNIRLSASCSYAAAVLARQKP